MAELPGIDSMTDDADLQRFVDAQESDYQTALAEIRAGQKRSHWMWYIFPQYQGLGFSFTSRHFAIKSLAEARAYLEHPLLGPRLEACADALLSIDGRSAKQIFGWPDELKLKSSMTLFAQLAGAESVFAQVLDKYFAGARDDRTIELIDTRA
jgi:uncharacterized protein (DUF1810 family)